MMIFARRSLSFVFCVAIVATQAWIFSGTKSIAQDRHWIEPNTEFFGIPSNWLEGTVPTANENAIFDQGFGNKVHFASDHFSNNLNVLNGPVTFVGNQNYSLHGNCIVDDGGVLGLNNTDVDINSQLFVGLGGSGSLSLSNGASVSSTNSSAKIGQGSNANGSISVTGSGSQWTAADIHLGFYGSGSMHISNGGYVSGWTAVLGNPQSSNGGIGDGTASVSGAGSYFNLVSYLRVGGSGVGSLNIDSGGRVSSTFGTIAQFSAGVGQVTVNGVGSQWNNSSTLWVGRLGDGTLTVENGGLVSNTTGTIALGIDSVSNATVTGVGSQWENSSILEIGKLGNGTLTVEDGGLVSNTTGLIAVGTNSVSTATVTGSGSEWVNTNDLFVGGSENGPGGSGTLHINDGGLVSVGGVTTIYSTGAVNLDGGRFEFGEITYTEFSGINAVSGSMAGNIDHTAYTNAGSLGALDNDNVDLSEVTVSNTGILYGSASLGNALVNLGTGELDVVAGERMRFAGVGNTNVGEINNFGGTIRFDRDLTNHSGGFVSGRGQFIADGGWTNDGVMAFSGTSDILGDVDNQPGGQIVTSGGATTTFYDDVVHNGTEIRTGANSHSVFFGDVSGSAPFTGTGTVYFEGDLRPGNSPDVVNFEGDVVFGGGAGSFFELGGLNSSEFDQLLIDGDLTLDGSLDVALIDGFQLTFNDEFLIADVGGQLSGGFVGLDEGALVGNFDGTDLFITYSGGDGNDVVLFTSVPEPSVLFFLAIALIGIVLVPRRKRNQVSMKSTKQSNNQACSRNNLMKFRRSASTLALLLVVFFLPDSTDADIITFQQGVNEYLGTQDTNIKSNQGSNHLNPNIATHAPAGGLYPSQGLLRFDDIFGPDPGQIPVGSDIQSATLRLHSQVSGTATGGTGIHLHRFLIDWQEDNVSWETFKYNGNTLDGIQADGLEASSANSATFTPPAWDTDVDIDVTTDLQAWISDPSSNFGWALLVDVGNNPNDTYVQYSSNYTGNIGHRPELIINYSQVPEPGSAFTCFAILIGVFISTCNRGSKRDRL